SLSPAPAAATIAAVSRRPVSRTGSPERRPSSRRTRGCRRTTPRRLSSAAERRLVVSVRAVGWSPAADAPRPVVPISVTFVSVTVARWPPRWSRAGGARWASRVRSVRLRRVRAGSVWIGSPLPPAGDQVEDPARSSVHSAPQLHSTHPEGLRERPDDTPATTAHDSTLRPSATGANSGPPPRGEDERKASP